ncbi:MAG: N-acetyltransferase [Hyphomicrobiaceae bacterium]|nr:MAG: N-acetyltransferase [Hyphomicrobiaceae bacterium]
MSPEARKARAEQMGFDTSRVLHHGTMKTFDQFDPSSPATSTVVRKRGDQIHLTSSRDEAAQYGDNIVDVYVRGRMHEASMPIAARHDEIIDKLRSVRDKNYNGDATDAAARKADRFVDHNEGDDSFVQKLIQREIAIARGKGFDGVILRGGLGDKFAGDHYIIFDPTNIRSVNATFDPAEAGSARLLAALSGGKYERRLEIPYAWSRVTKARAQQLIAELKERIESLESGKERPMGSYSVSDLANHFRENLRGIEAVLPKFDMPTEALRKPFKPSKIVEAGENFVARVATDERHKERAWTGDITYYLHRKPTEAVSKSGRLFGENATAKDLGPELGKVGLYKHDDGRWEVGMVEVKQKYRRMGVASALYDAIEEEMGIKMQPSGILLPDGYRYWSKREPESTRFHQKVNLYGNDLYLSPKRIMKDLAATEQNLSSIRNRLALLEKDGPSPTQSREDWEREVRNRKLDVASYERNRDTYMAALDAVPADGKTQEALDAMFALSGYRQGRNVTEPENLRFWQKPPASGDVLMFHGTRKTFDKFDMSYSRDFGVHFGTAEQASERLVTTDMEGARTIPVEITLKNAIVMPDPGFWGPTEVAGGLMRAGYQVAQAEFDRFQRLAVAIDEAANGNDPKATRSAIIAANQAIAEKLNALGIDGIWYRNRHEGTGWSLTVWNKGQVRSATSNDVLMAMRPSIANRTMPDGQRRVATAGTAEPARSLSQLVADLNQALGLTTRVGRLSPGLKAQASAAGGKLRGQYNTATDVTRLAIPLDIETLSHEGGHALEERFGLPLRVLMEANATEIEKLATPGNDQLSEGFAEFIRRYVTNPNMAEARAPKFFKAFEQFVDKVEPSLLKRLHEVTTGYQDWINAPSGGAVLSTIKSAKKDGLVAELTKHARKNGFRNVAVDYFHSAYTAIIDGLHPVKMAVDKLIDIANTNLATPLGARSDVGVIAARDPYKLLRLARNAYQGGHVDLMRGVRDYHTHEHKGPSLHDAIGVAMGGFESSHWTDDNIKAFGAYLISRRMVAEWNRFKAGELEGMPDKLSQADHIQAQKDFEQQFPQFIDAAELVYQYQRNLLRKAMEAGFVSEDTYEDLIKRSDYVPAHRDMSEDAEETVAGPGAQTVGANKARLLKQFRGSTRDIINPLETIAKTTYEWNFLIARNDAIKALDRLARAVGPGGGKIAERIPSSQMSGTQVNAIEIVKRAGKQAGMDEADLLFLTNTLEEQLGDDADTVIFRPGEITEGGEPIVYLWEGGKRVAIRLADGKFGKDMYESITGIGRENLGPILELVAKPSQWLRAGVTLDPAFVAANWIRDNPAAWINSADHGTFLPRADRSLRASVDALRAAFGTKVDDLDILSSTGGIVGGAGMEGMSASRIERDIKALQKKGIRIRDALPHKKQFWELTGVTETGTRLSVFRAARERALADGLDEYEATVEAAYTANDLIDFGRHGSKMLAARRLVTFLNAFVQGIDKGIRTGAGGSEVKRAVQDVISPYVRQSDGQVLTVLERKAVPVAAQFYMKMTMIGFVGFALSAVYKDDPEYEEIPEYFRNTHWIFKDATGTWRRVPKPFELGAMSLVMERTFEAYYKGDTKAMKRLVSGLGDLVAPPHVVPGVQVAYELWANKSSFTGGPIVPPNLEKLPGELQFTAYTSELSKWMAVGTGVSAAKIDHAIAGITGSLGRSLLDKSNVIMPPVGMFLQERGMPTLGLPTTPRPEQRDVDRIFVRRFTVDPARSSESKKEFWKEMSTTNGEMAIKAAGYKEFYDRAQFDEAAQTLKRMKEHERVYALVEGHGNATDKREHPMNRAKSVLEVTNGIRRDLDTGKMKDDNGNAYSPSDRRVIQEMFEQIQMREARNSQIVLGLPGFTHLKIMPVEPVIRELEAKVPSIAEELDYRLRKARVKDFDEVRDGYADLKARVLEPDYVEANPPRRKAGRRSP